PDTERRWIGSRNQRIHFLTPRYSYDEQWRQKNTLEIRVDRDGISVNGFPAANAVGLWKGWKRKKPVPLPTVTEQSKAQGTETQRPERPRHQLDHQNRTGRGRCRSSSSTCFASSASSWVATPPTRDSSSCERPSLAPNASARVPWIW